MLNLFGKFISPLTAILIIATLLIGYKTMGSFAGLNTVAAAETSVAIIDPGYTNRDLTGTWDGAAATTVSLNASSIDVSGPGASASGGTLDITAAGVYVLSGTLNDGQIIVEADDSDKVQIVLNNVSIACSNSAPIYVKQADKVFLTLADGTKNTVTDGPVYTLADGEDEPNAAIFSKDDLTINGAGELTVHGKYKNGIVSKDDLVITSGTITVTAVNDGLKGRDGVAVHDGTFVINAAQGDGIQSNNDEDTDKGWISIDGGTFNITAGNDGIQAETILQITDGTMTIKAGGGSANSSTGDKSNERPIGDKWRNETAFSTTQESLEKINTIESTDSSKSAKGVKAGTAINITGGNIHIDSADDAVHSNGDVIITGGALTISSGNDGIHADVSLVVDNATIGILESYEGLEGTTITIKGGKIHITAKDDGLNAAGGSDNMFIRITDGLVVINANGDGIDANGSLYIDGGTVLVNGPTNNGNGPLDYDGVAEITGGTIVAAGSSGMVQNFSESSSQNSLLIVYSSVQKAGTLISLLDEKGKPILSFAPAKDYQSIVISTPELEQGKTYTLYSGGSAGGNNTDGLYTDKKYSAGSKIVSVTLSGTATSISDNGEQISRISGPGGMAGHGEPGGGPKMNGPKGGMMPEKIQ